jgi:hypothetical protein
MSAQHTPTPSAIKAAENELAADSGRDLCVCSQCKTRHFNSDRPCPACGAGLYWQVWSEDDKPIASHANYAKAYDAKAALLRAEASRCEAWAEAHRAAMAKATEGAS